MFVFSKAEKWYDIIQIFQSFLESRNMMIDLFYFHNNIAMYTPHFRSKLVPPCTTWNSNIIAYILEEAGIGNSYSYAYVESSCYSYVIEANIGVKFLKQTSLPTACLYRHFLSLEMLLSLARKQMSSGS
jgi:hypothetical protein